MNFSAIPPLLEEFAVLLELKGENPFKVRAYQNAARALETYAGDLEEHAAEGSWAEIKGIGKGIAHDLAQWARTGKIAALEELRASFPAALFDLLRVPGLGPKKVKKLYESLGIASLGELEYACLENRLTTLDGFGEKTQAKILQGVQYAKQAQGKFLLPEALAVARDLEAFVAGLPSAKGAAIAGSLRRRKETVHDIDIVCAAADPSAVMQAFVGMAGVEEVIGSGDTKTSVRLRGMQADLRVVAPKELPFALHHFTGSKEHNTLLRGHAKKLGFTLNEYGLFKGDKPVACASEVELYAALGMDFIPPELREGRDEVELALARKLPALVEAEDIRGFFHNHTVFSDGKNTVEEMVSAAAAAGYEYIGLSDHSQSAFYAHGLHEKDIDAQFKEIDRVQKKFPRIRVFRGIESDILPDGALDYPEKILRRFDFVIGSVHSKMKMEEAEMTERCARALANPYLTILGHPTGRLLLAREGFPLHLPTIIAAARRHGKVLELNANPHRLDLDWRVLGAVRDAGVRVSINPDAHEVDGIAHIAYGVSMARKGGLRKGDVFNARGAAEIEKLLHGA